VVIKSNPKIALVYFNRGMAKYDLKDVDGGCKDILKSKELGYKSGYSMMKKNCE